MRSEATTVTLEAPFERMLSEAAPTSASRSRDYAHRDRCFNPIHTRRCLAARRARARPGVALPYRFVRVTPSPRATREGGEHGLFPCRHADGRSQDLAAPRVTACAVA